MFLVALPILIGFGVWQWQRMQWKEALLAELARNSAAPVVILSHADNPDDFQFRRVRVEIGCEPPPPEVRAGRNRAGENGYAVLVRCAFSDPNDYGEGRLMLNTGWGPRPESWKAATDNWPSRAPQMAEGVLVRRDGFPEWMLVATKATPPLLASAPPGIETISNNHLSYAIQWFGFAAVLSVIYAIFVRRWRLAVPGNDR